MDGYKLDGNKRNPIRIAALRAGIADVKLKVV